MTNEKAIAVIIASDNTEYLRNLNNNVILTTITSRKSAKHFTDAIALHLLKYDYACFRDILVTYILFMYP
jgi:hypothetical protein